MFDEEFYTFPKRLITGLKLAGTYNILWGIVVVLFPRLLFANFGMAEPSYLIFWQVIGLFVAVLGIGYLVSARDPIRFWPLVMTGFLIKLFGFSGFVLAIFQGTLPAEFWYAAIINHLIWLPLFGAILLEVYKNWVLETRSLEEEQFLEHHFNEIETNQGSSLQAMSHQWPVVLVFLRQFGCTFCRETLADLAGLKDELERKGKALVIVHMGDEALAEAVMSQYGLRNVHHICDKERNIYRYFGLRRGFIHQVFGPRNWKRFYEAGWREGYGMGKTNGDPFQMPGVFLYYKGTIKKQYIPVLAGVKLDY
jgi:peroxiredoxin